MANAIQHYEIGQDFQLSTNSQLSSFSSNQYSWTGRTLTSWIDDEGVYHLPAAIVNFNRNKVDLSANWELNKYNVSVDFKSAHGKVVATTYCDELPLFSPVNNSIELTKNGQTSSNILYNSLLSIDVVPENENHTTTRFEVNGISQPLSEQYVYRNIATDDKTGDNGFIIIVDFADEVQPEEPETPIDLTEPLCFTAEDPGATITLNKGEGSYNISIVTSTDKQNWAPYEIGTTITLTNVGDKVYFRATDDVMNDTYGYKFSTNPNAKIAASGNLNTLLKADGSVIDLSSYTIDSGNTNNGTYCYKFMFEGCTSLTKAPELPATTLADQCYSGMFISCTSLTQAPTLPATTLAIECYNDMFYGCTSLIQVPSILPVETLANNCCHSMFEGCTSLTKAPELPATTLAEECYMNMFAGCSSLTQAPELPATTLANKCYYNMFYECTSLTSVTSILPATTLATYCYSHMFYKCTSLTQAPALPATILANGCYDRMFNVCTSLTQAPALPATTLAEQCYYGMFWSCFSLTKAPELPATTLAKECYMHMFSNCNKLNNINVNFSVWNSENDATLFWVTNVSSSGTFICPETLPQEFGSDRIPTGWTVITN